MDKVDFAQVEWRKSSYSSGNGQCVEIAYIGQAVAMRDSKNPTGPVLVFTPDEFTAFVCGVQSGEFTRS